MNRHDVFDGYVSAGWEPPDPTPTRLPRTGVHLWAPIGFCKDCGFSLFRDDKEHFAMSPECLIRKVSDL